MATATDRPPFIEKPRFSCPLGGAMATVGALPKAVAVLHASQGCGGNSNGAIMQAAGHLGSGYCGGASIPARITAKLPRSDAFRVIAMS